MKCSGWKSLFFRAGLLNGSHLQRLVQEGEKRWNSHQQRQKAQQRLPLLTGISLELAATVVGPRSSSFSGAPAKNCSDCEEEILYEKVRQPQTLIPCSRAQLLWSGLNFLHQPWTQGGTAFNMTQLHSCIHEGIPWENQICLEDFGVGKRFLPVECPKTFPLGTVGAEIICANQRNRSKCILSKRGQFCPGEYKGRLNAEMYLCFDLPVLTIFCPIPGPRLFRLILDNSRKLADHEVTTRTIKNLPFECRSTLTSESWILSTLTRPRGQLCIMLSQMTKLYLEIGAFRQCCRWLCFPCVPVGTTTIQMFLPHEEGAQMRTGCTGVTTWFGGLVVHSLPGVLIFLHASRRAWEMSASFVVFYNTADLSANKQYWHFLLSNEQRFSATHTQLFY